MKQILATMAGTIVGISVSVGDRIQEGQDVAVLESMKMEVPITSDQSGKVAAIKAAIGDFVNEGDILLIIE